MGIAHTDYKHALGEHDKLMVIRDSLIEALANCSGYKNRLELMEEIRFIEDMLENNSRYIDQLYRLIN